MVDKLECTVFKASTQDVQQRERISYWGAVLADIWGHIQIEPHNPHQFAGRIRSIKSNQLIFNEIRYRGHSIIRTKADIAKMKQGFYALAFPLGKPWMMTHNRQKIVLNPGNMYLLSNILPYRSHDREGYDTFNVMIPSNLLENHLPHLEPNYTFPIMGHNKKANIIHDFVKSMHGVLPFESEEDALLMEDSLLNILIFMLKDKTGSISSDDSSVRLAHRRRVLSYIAKNLSNENLSPESLAAQHGISVSYLHRIFKPTGRTVVGEIRHTRLARAREILLDPTLAGLSITEIAYSVGFKHPSDFSRAFKLRYGLSPREARKDQSRPHIDPSS